MVNLVSIIQTLSVFKSILNIENAKTIPSGLHYRNPSKEVVEQHDFSACIRFRFKRLGITSADARILTIPNPKIIDNSRLFLKTYVRYGATWFDFGNYEKVNGFSSFVIGDVYKDDFQIWSIDRWHHVCLAFDKNNFKVIFVKVRKTKFLVMNDREKIHVVHFLKNAGFIQYNFEFSRQKLTIEH